MLEIIGLDILFRRLFTAYFVLGLVLAAVVVWLVPKWPFKLLGAAAVLVAFAWPPVQIKNERQDAARAFTERRAAAVARMDELCKNAGEFIHRTADGVEGLFLIKLRPTDYIETNQWAVDPYGYDGDEMWTGGRGALASEPRHRVPDSYVASFLHPRDEDGAFVQDPKQYPTPRYAYVDVIDPTDGVRYRYTGRSYVPEHLKNNPNYTGSYRKFELKREPVTPDMPMPRYGVTFDDITEHEDRARWWIAGSSLRVIDLETNEVMGERITYLMDSEIGEGRRNWTTIRAYGRMCDWIKPGFSPTRSFTTKVLKPLEHRQ